MSKVIFDMGARHPRSNDEELVFIPLRVIPDHPEDAESAKSLEKIITATLNITPEQALNVKLRR